MELGSILCSLLSPGTPAHRDCQFQLTLVAQGTNYTKELFPLESQAQLFSSLLPGVVADLLLFSSVTALALRVTWPV